MIQGLEKAPVYAAVLERGENPNEATGARLPKSTRDRHPHHQHPSLGKVCTCGEFTQKQRHAG